LKGKKGGCKNLFMKQNKIIPYNPKLRILARQLRNNSTLSKVLLWNQIKRKSLGYEFHRQVPIDDFIVDFFCHELLLVIEIDGSTHDYNFDYDNKRELILEKYGIRFVRFQDKDVKNGINDVIRSLENYISEIELMKEHPPDPPSKGDF
jgi:very-short-patch-repair endonuclease